MEQTEVEKLIGELETALDRLRSLYEQYFVGHREDRARGRRARTSSGASTCSGRSRSATRPCATASRWCSRGTTRTRRTGCASAGRSRTGRTSGTSCGRSDGSGAPARRAAGRRSRRLRFTPSWKRRSEATWPRRWPASIRSRRPTRSRSTSASTTARAPPRVRPRSAQPWPQLRPRQRSCPSRSPRPSSRDLAPRRHG